MEFVDRAGASFTESGAARMVSALVWGAADFVGVGGAWMTDRPRETVGPDEFWAADGVAGVAGTVRGVMDGLPGAGAGDGCVRRFG